MIKSKKAWIVITAVFAVAQTVFAHFIQNPPSARAYAWLTLLSVALAAVYVLLAFETTPFKIVMLVAFGATVVSDFFLTELVSFEGQKVVAMCFFCVVQLSYFLRLYLNHRSKTAQKAHLVTRALFCMVGLLAAGLVLQEKNNAISVVSIFYFANLAVNLIFSFLQIKLSVLFAIGLLFFVACDLLIGLNEMAVGFIPMAETSFIYKLTNTGYNLAWMFYVPAQTLLAISVHDAAKGGGLCKSCKKGEKAVKSD